jgi:hypothetical protein
VGFFSGAVFLHVFPQQEATLSFCSLDGKRVRGQVHDDGGWQALDKFMEGQSPDRRKSGHTIRFQFSDDQNFMLLMMMKEWWKSPLNPRHQVLFPRSPGGWFPIAGIIFGIVAVEGIVLLILFIRTRRRRTKGASPRKIDE